ncbi:MAG: cytochrome c oxidase subunit 3 [Alphaproteobacteria bacterium CG11_big_fil_rev_8_21_14_0_20_44_7]|nr:MAG: cytochrome c oxidase subunit 3 [Alphaproteobacteria bacterium CG11_big_fil_rev_8_21_14_0_20_44_7]
MSAQQDHDFHLVDPSPWPLLASMGFLVMAGGTAFAFHNTPYAEYAMIGGLLSLLYVGYRWWKDCIREGAEDKAHTSIVQKGLRYGMLLFIVSEVMFFFAFFFSYFHSMFLPMEMPWGEAWSAKEGVFPPETIEAIDPWDLPLFNTLLLLMSGTTVTWAHAALLQGNQRDLVRGLLLTIILGITFTVVQAIEYHHIINHMYKFSENNFSSNFFMATGFHGLHVIIGTIFLIICLIRAFKGQFSEKHHLGFEFAAWYWHFVDIVWLFLFASVYLGGR